MRALVLLLATVPLAAQVTVQAIPEPMEVLAALHVRGAGLWQVMACNDGAAAVTVPPERLYMALAAIRPLRPADALRVLTAGQRRSVAAIVARVAGYAGQAAAIGLAVASRANVSTSLWVSTASGILPQIVTTASGQTPDISGLQGDILNGPVSLAPGGCTTRVVFAARQKAPQPISVRIP